MKRRAAGIGYGLIVLWMFGPVLLSVAAGMVASALGCRLDEGSIRPCVVMGKDQGPTLYFLGMMGWFSLATFPTGLLALVVLTLILWWRNRRAAHDREA